MDEKIRAKAEELHEKTNILHCNNWPDPNPNIAIIEAALTKVGDAAWKEGVEAAGKAIPEQMPPSEPAAYYRGASMARHLKEEAIRRLKRSKP